MDENVTSISDVLKLNTYKQVKYLSLKNLLKFALKCLNEQPQHNLHQTGHI